jgi:hypothetical protein
MLSEAMQNLIDALRQEQKAGASQGLLTPKERRAQIMLGTPEAAEATEQIGRFLGPGSLTVG